MSKHTIFLTLIFISSIAYGQKKNLKYANKLFDKKAYIEAAKVYEKLDHSQEMLQKLGDCYYYNYQMDKAKTVYGWLFNSYKDSIKPKIYFRYAQALKGANDYDTADKIMSEYLGQDINTSEFIENTQKRVPYNYETKLVNSGSSSGDFGVTYFGEKVVFASLRNTENPEYSWNNKPYLDLYEATVSTNKDLENIIPFSDKINSKTHESSAVFTSDGKRMYFSRTNDKQVQIGDEKYAVVKIYRADLVNDEWTNITELPFSNDLYSTQHPVLNKANTKLFFASDMPGSEGSFDIYYVTISSNNYGEPINLGNTINTKHREQFPYISDDETLYFASDGHEGLGNLDIFMATVKDSLYSNPQNLGATINTSMDDFGLILKDSLHEGFFTSNRDGVDKLYAFTRIENERLYIVEGDVRDKKTKALLPGTKVTLLNEDDSVVGEVIVGENGKYQFNIKPNSTYKIEGYKDFYIPTIENFDTNEEGKIEYNIELILELYDDAEDIVVTKSDGDFHIELENIYFDLDKWDIKPDAAKTLNILVDLLKKYPKMEIQIGAHTDFRSSDAYNLKLSDNRARSTLDYLVSNGIARNRLKSKGFGESQPLVACGNTCTEDEHAINRRCEFILLK